VLPAIFFFRLRAGVCALPGIGWWKLKHKGLCFMTFSETMISFIGVAVLVALLWLAWRSTIGRLGKVSRKQLRALKSASLDRKQIMRRGEHQLYGQLQTLLAAYDRGYQVFPQVSMGELIACDTDEGFLAINSKRVDFAITDAKGYPVILVEYQGEGHDLDGTAKGRDTVKREAATRAGIGFLEVFPDYDVDGLKADIQMLLEETS
jgi:hypothetical protein